MPTRLRGLKLSSPCPFHEERWTVSESYYAGAYWGPRRESSEECARRMGTLLAGLPSVDPSLASWYQQGKSRKDALKKPLRPDPAALELFVRQGKDRIFEDLGFSVGGWNGASDDYEVSGFLIRCGAYSEGGGNRCVFTLPSKGPSQDRLVTASALAALMGKTAAAWEPDWGVAISEQHRDLAKPRHAKGAPHVGWVTYLSARRGTVPPLPAPVRIEPVEDKGTLITLTPERFTVSNLEHMTLAEQVRELLDRAGLLKPLQARP
ncbi:immunity 52 family protein [Corallococcus interemptor]|uniref:immunity 52 family protein n=1 Tax=Corallococcus interemptor TaxID=2316720 RepID=UPI003D0530D4